MSENVTLRRADVVIGASAATKWEAIARAGQVLVDSGAVSEDYLADMAARERLTTTYVGNHVAIPHGVNGSEAHIHSSAISVVQYPQGVDFDGETAYLVIGIAGKGGSHIELLSKIALVVLDPDNVERGRSATGPERIVALFDTALT